MLFRSPSIMIHLAAIFNRIFAPPSNIVLPAETQVKQFYQQGALNPSAYPLFADDQTRLPTIMSKTPGTLAAQLYGDRVGATSEITIQITSPAALSIPTALFPSKAVL